MGQIRPFLQGVRVVLWIGSTQSTSAIRAEHRIGLWDREISHHRLIFRLLLYKAGGLKAFFKVSLFILVPEKTQFDEVEGLVDRLTGRKKPYFKFIKTTSLMNF